MFLNSNLIAGLILMLGIFGISKTILMGTSRRKTYAIYDIATQIAFIVLFLVCSVVDDQELGTVWTLASIYQIFGTIINLIPKFYAPERIVRIWRSGTILLSPVYIIAIYASSKYISNAHFWTTSFWQYLLLSVPNLVYFGVSIYELLILLSKWQTGVLESKSETV